MTASHIEKAYEANPVVVRSAGINGNHLLGGIALLTTRHDLDHARRHTYLFRNPLERPSYVVTVERSGDVKFDVVEDAPVRQEQILGAIRTALAISHKQVGVVDTEQLPFSADIFKGLEHDPDQPSMVRVPAGVIHES